MKGKYVGWDAYAIKDGKSVQLRWCIPKYKYSFEVDDPSLRDGFQKAEEYVLAHAESVDGGLRVARLACSACADVLWKVLCESCYSDEDWSPEKTKKLAHDPRWDIAEVEHGWAYWSARVFLETCAEHNLGISFSW